MYCDLHTHSNCSDGTYTPTELINLAKQENRILALTDHNTVSGLPEFTVQAKQEGVTAVNGVELSAEYEGRELHLIGLFLEEPYWSQVESWTDDIRAKKEQSNRQMVDRLCADRYEIDYDDLIDVNGKNINRAHLAHALCRGGYVSSIQEAFNTLLGENHGYYIPPVRPSFLDAVSFLRQVRAVPAFAHPLKDMDEFSLCQLLKLAIPAGLVGMEIYHSSYDAYQSKTAAEIANKYGLLPCGGSDFHGCRKPNVPFGIPEIPRKVYDDLLQYKMSAF